MKLKIMFLLTFLMLMPIIAKASNISLGYEYKNLRNKYETKVNGNVLRNGAKAEFGLLNAFVDMGPAIGFKEGIFLGVGYKTDLFYGKSQFYNNEINHSSYDISKKDNADFSELYLKFGGGITPNWKGLFLFNYQKFEQDKSISECLSNRFYKYEDDSYGIEGRLEYSIQASNYEFGAGFGILAQRGKTKDYIFQAATTTENQFKYWNLGGSVDMFVGFNITENLNTRAGYKFTYSKNISIDGEKYNIISGCPSSPASDVSDNQKIDNTLWIDLSYKF